MEVNETYECLFEILVKIIDQRKSKEIERKCFGVKSVNVFFVDLFQFPLESITGSENINKWPYFPNTL